MSCCKTSCKQRRSPCPQALRKLRKLPQDQWRAPVGWFLFLALAAPHQRKRTKPTRKQCLPCLHQGALQKSPRQCLPRQLQRQTLHRMCLQPASIPQPTGSSTRSWFLAYTCCRDVPLCLVFLFSLWVALS